MFRGGGERVKCKPYPPISGLGENSTRAENREGSILVCIIQFLVGCRVGGCLGGGRVGGGGEGEGVICQIKDAVRAP